MYFKRPKICSRNIVLGVDGTSTKPIDLGLPSGTKWGSTNVGAENPWEEGLYFSWANGFGYYRNGGYSFDVSNYNSTPGVSLQASIPTHSPIYDGGTCIGYPWITPSLSDFQELINNTDSEWTTMEGKQGRKFMKKSDHSVFIFIPASGYYTGTTLTNDDVEIYCHSSNIVDSGWNYSLKSSSSAVQMYKYNDRRLGENIRPIIKQ